MFLAGERYPHHMSSAKSARFVFLGTGTSERVPRVTCLSQQPATCPVCIDSQRPGSKNYRRNTSLLVQTASGSGSQVNIVIDAGKSFYEACMQWFPKFGVTTLDAVVLTHAHADAVAGLDDLRDWTMSTGNSMPLFVRSEDIPTLSKTHFYLLKPAIKMSGGGVARLDVVEIGDQPFDVLGVKFTPLPVEHGQGFSTNGYRIGNVCYIPDVSSIPESTEKLLEGCEVLVLDALRRGRTHGSHLTLEEAIEVAKKLRAPRTLLTDMAHELDHEPVNEELARLKISDGIDIQLAYDGLSFESEV